MPSKSKKHSKAASKLSYLDQCASPQSSSSLIPLPEPEVSEEDLLCSLEEATNKYPSLIGKSAFIGLVTDVEAESKGCKIWLSESSMVASSLAPGSTVSQLDHIAWLVFSATLYIANFGDSRAVLGRLVKAIGEVLAIQLSEEHNAAIESARQELHSLHLDDPQIVVLKHIVWRVKGLIQVSRYVGDAYLKKKSFEFNREPLYAKFQLLEPYENAGIELRTINLSAPTPAA